MAISTEEVEYQSDDSIEDYDDLELDPDTLVTNSRRSLDDGVRSSELKASLDGVLEQSLRRASLPDGPRPTLAKRNIIPIRIEKTGRRGRYVLMADDPEIKEILRRGIEREELEAVGRKPRNRFRDLVFTRQFTTFDRQNPLSADSPFFGFFTLFWLAMLLLFFQVAMHNWRDYGSILGRNQIMKMMFSRDVLVLGITDGVMYASTGVSFLMQKAVQKGWVSWPRGGWIVQNVWQTIYLFAVIAWAYFREWPWTHTIFAVLHGLVFVMKQHSYAFYNGHLAGVLQRRTALHRKLAQLERMEPNATSPTSPHAAVFTTGFDRGDTTTPNPSISATKPRSTLSSRDSPNLTQEKSEVASVAAAIEAGTAIDAEQMKTFASIINAEIEGCNRELHDQPLSEQKQTPYPSNLTLFNFFEYICLPTLVYELDYPRQERINWWYVLEKTTATFGVLCVMMVISQAYIYPPVAKTVQMKEAGMPIEERWRELPFIVSDMLFPLLIEQLLTWYLIWECILNVLAEVTRFADRGFYGDWWNSVTWDQYARDWNRPVHNFLLRHVYHSSVSTFHLSRQTATFVTFLLSALVHEMCMALMFRKVRGYLFCMQLLQMPLVSLSRSRLLKGRVVLGNVLFWMGLFVGPSVLTALYLVI